MVERMLAGGSWVTPPDENGPFLEKPPLRFWIVAAAMSAGLLRPTEGGHRAVDAILGAVALLYVFLVARRLGGLAAGVGAVFLAIAQTQLMFVHGLRSGTMEPLLVLAYCGAVAHFLWWAEGGGRRHAYAVGGWLAAAILAKFVAAAPLFVILASALALVPSWRARAVADARAWSVAAALCALVAVPWFLYQTIRHGTGFWEVILGLHVFARIASWVDPSHVKPWWYYPHFIAGGLSETWEYFVAGALVMAWRARTGSQPAVVLMALWFVVPVALFSMATSKLGHYVHPAMPALAVIGGQAFAAAAALVRGIARRDGLSVRARAIAAGVAAVSLVALIGGDAEREYGNAMVRARSRGRHLGALADCVRARLGGRPGAFHVHAERELGRDEKYYFRRVGLQETPESDPERLASRLLFSTEAQVITVDQYRRLTPAMAAWPPEAHAAYSVAVLPQRRLVVFLPGETRPCAAAARRIP